MQIPKFVDSQVKAIVNSPIPNEVDNLVLMDPEEVVQEIKALGVIDAAGFSISPNGKRDPDGIYPSYVVKVDGTQIEINRDEVNISKVYEGTQHSDPEVSMECEEALDQLSELCGKDFWANHQSYTPADMAQEIRALTRSTSVEDVLEGHDIMDRLYTVFADEEANPDIAVWVQMTLDSLNYLLLNNK